MSTNLSIGTQLNSPTIQYEIESVLGQGSFGITYKAKGFTIVKGALGEMKMELPQPIAIKEFFMRDINQRSDDGTITGMTQGSMAYNYALKFRKEAENLARMSHPNIVRVIDFIEANNTFYYVMEYVDGEDMNSYLKAHTMSEKEAISVILDVARALKYMHEEQHMLHLDLKPGNIMRRKDDGHIYLIDFGLSKHYGDDGNPDTSTTVGLGTEGYAPLEQGKRAKDRNDFLPTIDVYALGATFFKLLTGKTPPAASDVLDDEDIIPDELTQAKISSDIIDIVVKAMKPGAKKRTASVNDFILAFNHIIPDPIKVSTTSPVHVMAKESVSLLLSDNETTVIMDRPKCLIREFADKCEVNIDRLDYSFRKIPAGDFTIGEQSGTISQVTHEVKLTKGFYLATTPVTQRLWLYVMGSNNSMNKGMFRPVENVSWHDCQEFITRLNSITGLQFRLPTEAEWEYAAKGGNKSKGYSFAGSDQMENVGWYELNSNKTSHVVMSLNPNELGLYDMCGNIWEWCQDWYREFTMKSEIDPKGPDSGQKKVIKGGGYFSSALMCHPGYRNSEYPDKRKQATGFRLVLEIS